LHRLDNGCVLFVDHFQDVEVKISKKYYDDIEEQLNDFAFIMIKGKDITNYGHFEIDQFSNQTECCVVGYPGDLDFGLNLYISKTEVLEEGGVKLKHNGDTWKGQSGCPILPNGKAIATHVRGGTSTNECLKNIFLDDVELISL